MDRIDMHVELSALSDAVLTSRRTGESSASMRERVFAARKIQMERYKGLGFLDNASLNGKIMDDVCALDGECREIIKCIIDQLQLSARSYDRILRVARTLADLDGGGPIRPAHLNEAAGYRILDRQNW